MQLRQRANYVIAVIVVGAAIVAGSLFLLSQNGQILPAGMNGGATKSDQRDAAVSSDVANHKR